MFVQKTNGFEDIQKMYFFIEDKWMSLETLGHMTGVSPYYKANAKSQPNR